MIGKMGKEQTEIPEWKLQIFQWYAYSVATTFGLLGIVLLFVAFYGNSSWLNQEDPLFGRTNCMLLLFFAISHVALCGWLFRTRNILTRLVVPLWVGANYFFYRLAMVWGMKIMAPFPAVRFLARRIDAPPGMLDACWKVLIGYLAIGSLALLFMKWYSSEDVAIKSWFAYCKKRHSGRFYTISCLSCGGHIKFSTQNVGCQIACPHCQKFIHLRKPGTFKMSCFFCNGHIEFSDDEVGRRTQCPHCKMDITLKAEM